MNKLYKVNDSFFEYKYEYGFDQRIINWLRTHTFMGEFEPDRNGRRPTTPDIRTTTPYGEIFIVYGDYEEVVSLLPEELFKI